MFYEYFFVYFSVFKHVKMLLALDLSVILRASDLYPKSIVLPIFHMEQLNLLLKNLVSTSARAALEQIVNRIVCPAAWST